MARTFTDQAYPINAYWVSLPATLTVQPITITDIDENGIIEVGDTADGLTIVAIAVGDRVTVDGQVFEGASLDLSDGSSRFVALDGQVLIDGTATDAFSEDLDLRFTTPELAPPCFTPGTHILTPRGEVPIETLSIGDPVLTLDRGAQPIRWIGRTEVPGHGRFAPVRIAAHVFGNDRAFSVSQQHRLMLDGARVELFCGDPELLAAAKHLVDGQRVQIEACRRVTYFHLLFDRHEIIFAEGAATESFHPGRQILGQDTALRAELLALFPELGTGCGDPRRQPARPIMTGEEARLLRPQSGVAVCAPVA